MDLTLLSAPVTFYSVLVNSGLSVQVDTALTNNDATHWRSSPTPTNIDGAARSLFGDAVAGYAISSPIQWSAPNTRAAPLPLSMVTGTASTGVRFYSTNGVVPDVNVSIEQVDRQEIEWSYTSRGLTTPDRMRDKLARTLVAVLETWNPSYDIALVQDGANEESSLVQGETRSRTRYTKPWDRAAWDATNVNDDFPEPFREDYSLTLSTVRPDTERGFNLGDGLQLGLHQERRHDLSISGRGRSPRVRISGTQGRARVLALGYEGTGEGNALRRDT
jgi:hypothetical protein